MSSIPTSEHRAALALGTEWLIAADDSGLTPEQITAAVSAARTQILSGYQLLGAEVPSPAEYVRTVTELATKDIHLVRPRRYKPDPPDDATS